ncbi:hypothetical protein ENUP19_0117G0003 [Entamoeba nuttalli]|uniref:Uncharacterized protein n=2 Tax=Entamoeba nuttalli TaxID=412467 RepID=K2H8F7_ENTNP|nr:hypothetical protein ENU1_152690 [Entamoeba nuttalli P19]EKE38804.1 hypothetical protein ENU1_152690 [Entamoeba nuttalli P19]|eukprot:XP_008858860.1 hypothetical protein ENU1_152690 [Entamoeba nuttalli P19]
MDTELVQCKKTLYYFNLISIYDGNDIENEFIKSSETVIINLNKSIESFNEKKTENERVDDIISYNIKKKFIENYNALDEKQREELYFLIDYIKCLKDKIELKKRKKIIVPISLKEYYHGSTKEILVQKSPLKKVRVKIIVKPGCQKIFHFCSFDVILKVKPSERWSYKGLDLTYCLSQEDIRKKSFTHISGKVFSVPDFGTQSKLTCIGQGLILDGVTGSLTLKVSSE